ncbi:MAG: NAD-dependent epimerase/dehydratase [Fibrobacteres bacterium]|nr:NAD-dependent epimerase/dehydratase [Fibrobacterota bacterium]
MGGKRQTILGANGTIGAPLARELKAYTDTIRLVSRNPRKVNDSDELFPADLSQPEQVEKAVAGSDIVYLLVGFDYNLKVWRERWPKLMRATLDACARHKAKLVFFDNVYMYSKDAIPHMTEASPPDPPSKKGAVRREIAEMVMQAAKSGSVQAMIARSADFYGPDNAKSLLTEVVSNNLKKGKKANWVMDADKKHSFTFTPDAAKATALLGNTEDAYNQVWHLPTDPNALTGREMVALFVKEMGGPAGVSVLPMWLLKVLGLFMPIMREMPEMMYQYDRDYLFDSGKFDKRFSFRTTPYAQGVKLTVAAGATKP